MAKYSEKFFVDIDFHNLMQRRITHILLVCSSYDQFTLEEDGHIEAQIVREYGDLSLTNLLPLLVACENIAEVSIGHALVSEALQYGMTETVGRYNGVLLEAADRICAKTQPK